MTVSEVRGFGRQKVRPNAIAVLSTLLSFCKTKVEIVVEDNQVDMVVDKVPPPGQVRSVMAKFSYRPSTK